MEGTLGGLLDDSWRAAGHQRDQTMTRSLEFSDPVPALHTLFRGKERGWKQTYYPIRPMGSLHKIPIVQEGVNTSTPGKCYTATL